MLDLLHDLVVGALYFLLRLFIYRFLLSLERLLQLALDLVADVVDVADEVFVYLVSVVHLFTEFDQDQVESVKKLIDNAGLLDQRWDLAPILCGLEVLLLAADQRFQEEFVQLVLLVFKRHKKLVQQHLLLDVHALIHLIYHIPHVLQDAVIVFLENGLQYLILHQRVQINFLEVLFSEVLLQKTTNDLNIELHELLVGLLDRRFYHREFVELNLECRLVVLQEIINSLEVVVAVARSNQLNHVRVLWLFHPNYLQGNLCKPYLRESKE